MEILGESSGRQLEVLGEISRRYIWVFKGNPLGRCG